ncbi:MAG: RNA polymerase sigma factor [Chthoniobacteraceae bacterium]
MSRGAAEPDPDLELVESLAGGDESALDGLMARYEQPIFHFICRHVCHETDAREMTQEVFVRLFFNVAKFKPEAKFSTWLYQIALNLCRDHAKSRRTRQSAVTDSLSAHEDEEEHPARELAVEKGTPSDEALTREKMAALEAGMEALPPDLRTALVLTALEQRSHQECAELLKTTTKAVETRVYRARKQLHEWLAKAGFVLFLSGLIR